MPTLKPRRSRSTNMSSPSATAIATLSTLAAASSPAPSATSAATSSSTSTHEKVEITKKRKAELKRCEATVKRLKAIISDGTRDHRHSALVHQLFAVSDWIGGDLAEHYQTTVAKRKEEAEKNNDADAMCDLGWWHAEGMHGCEQDETKAFEWYEKAAQRGNEVAMGEAGHRLVDGVGTAKSVRYGVALTLGAAQLGYEVACYNAGTYLQDGIVGGGDHGHGTVNKFKFKLNVLQLSKLGQSPLTSQHMSAEHVHDRRHRCVNERKLSKRHTGGAKHHIRVTDEVYKLGKPIP